MNAFLKLFKTAALNLAQVLAATLVFLILFEGVFWAAGFPQGAQRFTEIVVIKNGLGAYKPKGEFRIFTYGESTMHGSHYWPASNPARWLDAYLKDFLPEKKIKVVNFARMGQGSDFIYGSFRDSAAYKPDLAVFYMGHNAFLFGNRKDQALDRKKGFSPFFKELIRRSRFMSFVYRKVIQVRIRTRKEKSEDTLELNRIESDPAGYNLINMTERNSPLYRENIDYYRENLERILKLAGKKKIPVIFFMPVGNLKDFAPYCSVHERSLSEAELKDWKANYALGQKLEGEGRAAEALLAYQKAYAIDPDFSALAYRMGEIELAKGNYPSAERYFKQSKDSDCIPVRAPKAVEDLFPQLSEKYGFLLMNTEKVLAPETQGGILGEPVVEDNVHFSVKGHSLLAKALAREIAARGWIAPESEWHFEKEKSFAEMSALLGINDNILFEAYLKNVYYLGSRYRARLIFAQKAEAIHPKDPRMLRHLAWTYWLMKDSQQALETYKRLGDLHPEILNQVLNEQPSIKEAFQKAFPAKSLS